LMGRVRRSVTSAAALAVITSVRFCRIEYTFSPAEHGNSVVRNTAQAQANAKEKNAHQRRA
jgi:hypothetical protein